MKQYTEAYKMQCAAQALWLVNKAENDIDMIGHINEYGGYDSNGKCVELERPEKLTNAELRLKIDKIRESKFKAYPVDNKYLCVKCSNIESFIKAGYEDAADIIIIDGASESDLESLSRIKCKFAVISGMYAVFGAIIESFYGTIHTQKGLELLDHKNIAAECIDNEYIDITNCVNVSIRCSISDNGWFTVKDSENCSIFINGLGNTLETCLLESVDNSCIFIDNIKSVLRISLCNNISIMTKKRYSDKIKLDNCKNCRITFIDDNSDNDKIVNNLSKYAKKAIKLGIDPFEEKAILSYAVGVFGRLPFEDIKIITEEECILDDVDLARLDKILNTLHNSKPTDAIKKKLAKFKMINSCPVNIIGGKFIGLKVEDKHNIIGADRADIVFCGNDYIPTDAVLNNTIIYGAFTNKDVSINGSLNADDAKIKAEINIANASFIGMVQCKCACLNIVTNEKCEMTFDNCEVGCINIINSHNIGFVAFFEHSGSFNIVNSKFEFLSFYNVSNSVINIKNCYGEIEIEWCEGYMLIINGEEVDTNTIPPYRIDEDGKGMIRIELYGSRWM